MNDQFKIAVGYVRCSTDKQDESIEQQKECLLVWAKNHQYSIIEWFEDEGKSGTSFDKRPSFMRLVHKVELNPNFEYVLVYDESRWGRASNPRESNYWKIHFERFDVKVIVINSRSSNKNDVGDYVIEVVESAEASEYSRKLGRSVLRGAKANARKGFKTGGTAPYGYHRQAENKVTSVKRVLYPGQHAIYKEEKVTLVLADPTEVKTVQRIFKMKAQGYGYRRIAAKLNVEGIPYHSRRHWADGNRKWSTSTIEAIVKNPIYYGDIVYNRNPQSKAIRLELEEHGINPKEEWIICQNAAPSIISRSLFDKANKTNGNSFASGGRYFVESFYLLTSLIKCENCGYNFQGDSDRTNNHYYYIDGGYNTRGKSVCYPYKIQKKEIEDFAIHSIKETIGKSDILKLVKKLVEKKFEGHSFQNTEKYSQIIEAIKENNIKKQNLILALERGVNMELLIGRLNEIEKQLNDLNSEKERLESLIVRESDVTQLASAIDSIVKDFERLFDSASIIEKKRFLRLFIEKIVIDQTKLEVKCFIRKIPNIDNLLSKNIFPDKYSSVGGTDRLKRRP